MTPENFIKAQLCSFAHQEAAHHGGINNMLAVALVLRNRQRAGWGDWMQVLESAPKASAVRYPATLPNLRDINFRSLMSKMDDIYSGVAEDKMTEGALYYAELNKIENQEFLENIVRRPKEHPRVATVGNVNFFR